MSTKLTPLQILQWALKGRGWVKCRDLSVWTALDDRQIRAIASDSGGSIISNEKGYCLTNEASHQDIRDFKSRMDSQARKMRHRVEEVEEYAGY